MEARILLADPQRLVREGVRRILEEHPGFTVVGEASDGEEAVRMITELRPDIALLEFLMPRLSGISAIRRIQKAETRTRCIVLSSQESRGNVEDALRAGAAGYVLKSAAAEEVVEAIAVVTSGRFYLSPNVTQHVVEAVTRPDETPKSALSLLTGREREVLQLIAEGLSTKEIASELGVSPKTADSHRANLMEKVVIHKASCLVRFAIREGLVTP